MRAAFSRRVHLERGGVGSPRALKDSDSASSAASAYATAAMAEPFYQGLMRCHLQQGEAAAGLAAYARLRAASPSDPATATEALHRRLLAL